MKSASLFVMIVVVLAAGVSPAATDRTWVGTGTTHPNVGPGDWSNGGNWTLGLDLDPNRPPSVAENVKIDMAGADVNVYFRAADPDGDPNVAGTLVAECKGLTLNGNVTPATLTIWPKAELNSAGGGDQFVTAQANDDDIAYVDVYGTLTVGNGPFISRRGPSTLTIYDGGVLVSGGNAEIQHGNGTINVMAGGIYENPGELKMARGANSPGQTKRSILNIEGGQARFVRLHTVRNDTCNSTVSINSGLMIITDDLYLSYAAAPGSAIINLDGGRLIVYDQIRSNATANVEFNFTGGELAVRNWTSAVPVVNDGGTLSPAVISYNAGDFSAVIDETHYSELRAGYEETSASAVMRVDIDGTNGWNGSGSEYDFIHMRSTAVTLMGELEVVLRGDYVNTISPSDSFIILNYASSITGGFNNLDVDDRVTIYNDQGGVEGTFLVTYGASRITLSDAIITNVPPTIAASDVCTYDAVKDTIVIDTTVDHPLGMGDVTFEWTVISQAAGSQITPDPTTLTTNDITIGVDMTGDYVLELKATKTSTGKFATAQITVAVEADACAAALRCGATLLDGDVNGDCEVNMTDLSLVAGNWLGCVSQDCP